jgi:hypothetical protein
MAYIGTKPTIGNFQICDAISVVNGQAAYTMQVGGVNVSPQSANHMIVSLNGVIQKPGSSFTVSGSTITFASNLVTNDVIDFIQILGSVLDLGVPSDATVTTAKLADSSVSLAKLTATGTKDATTFLRGDNTFASAQGKFESQLLQVRHETSGTTHGGDAAAATDNVRILNTVVTNEITGASLSSNQITLPAGTYYINHVGFAYDCSSHRTLLYNITDSSVTLLGTNAYADVNNQVGNHSFLKGRFTISSQKVFEIRHYTDTANSTFGLGVAGSDSRTNIFADVQLWKVA